MLFFHKLDSVEASPLFGKRLGGHWYKLHITDTDYRYRCLALWLTFCHRNPLFSEKKTTFKKKRQCDGRLLGGSRFEKLYITELVRSFSSFIDREKLFYLPYREQSLTVPIIGQ